MASSMKSSIRWKSSSRLVPQKAAAAVAGGAVPKKPPPEVGPHDDPFLPEPPTASIQVIRWAPKDYRLAAGCWDGSIIIWEVKVEKGERLIHRAAEQPGPFFTQKNFKCPGAVLDLAWHPSGLVLYAGCTDGNIYGIFFAIGDVQAIGKHDGPVKALNWCSDAEGLLSGSWDSTLRLWRPVGAVEGDDDVQRSMEHTLVDTAKVSERVYGAAVNGTNAIIITAGTVTNAEIWRISKPGIKFIRKVEHPLKLQLRCASTFGPWVKGGRRTELAAGYVIGSVEGRCAVGYFDENLTKENFAFKCHRDLTYACAVNSVHFHPHHNTFATAGSDGTFVFWDKDAKSRLKNFPRIPSRGPITSAQFSADGSMFAYAQSYDYAKGHNEALENQTRDCVRIHWTFLGQPGSDECIRK